MKYFLYLITLLLCITHLALAENVPGEYVLKANGNKSNWMSYFHEKSGNRAIIKEMGSDIFHVRLGDADIVEFKKRFGQEIKAIEPNYIYTINSIPAKQWGLRDIKAQEAWGVTRGSKEVIVAVIDTGVDYNHMALKDVMWSNPHEIPNNGIDDDQNGYIDDIHGWDFANNNSDPDDDNSHGTHCAGIIAANHPEVMGIAPNVKIMAIKFLSKDGGGTLDAAISAIQYAVKNGAHILSNSWGGTFRSEILEDVVRETEEAGVLFIAAAGNSYSNNDTRPHYPSNYPFANVISVAASTESGGKASFSNYGKKTVHLFAPGHNIYSSVPGDRMESLSGTSMAAPYVSGAAALILSHNPGRSALEIKDDLMKSVRKTSRFENLVISGGTLDAYAALMQ